MSILTLSSRIIPPPTPITASFRVGSSSTTKLNPGASVINGGGLKIECSSRPQKKSTAHHRKTRPRKSQPWDINRKPTQYPPLAALPPEWTLVSSASEDGVSVAVPETDIPSLALQTPVSGG